MGGIPIPQLPPPPMRDKFASTDGGASGISRPWFLWLQQVFNAMVGLFNATVAAISTIQLLIIVQATQATLPTLTLADVGVLVNVADYGHLLRWTGVVFEWAPGDAGSDYIASFITGPTGAGWHLCDGATVDRLNSDGTITSVTLPDYSSAAYVKLSTSTALGPSPASGSTTSVSAGTPAGTVSQPTFTGAADTTGAPSATTNVDLGAADTSVASATHTHSVTPTGTVSQPTFTGAALAAHSHGVGSIEMRNTQLTAYYRQ